MVRKTQDTLSMILNYYRKGLKWNITKLNIFLKPKSVSEGYIIDACWLKESSRKGLIW